jgi:hypothetical protein
MKTFPAKYFDSRVVAIGTFFATVFCCFGCHPADILDEKVAARTSFDFFDMEVVRGLQFTNERLAQLTGPRRAAAVDGKERGEKPSGAARAEAGHEDAEAVDEAPQLLTTGGHRQSP